MRRRGGEWGGGWERNQFIFFSLSQYLNDLYLTSKQDASIGHLLALFLFRLSTKDIRNAIYMIIWIWFIEFFLGLFSSNQSYWQCSTLFSQKFRRLRTSTNYIIFSLCCADLLVGISFPFSMVSQVWKFKAKMTIRKRMKLFSTIDRNLILYREPNNVLEDSLRKSKGGVKITTQIPALKRNTLSCLISDVPHVLTVSFQIYMFAANCITCHLLQRIYS